MTHLTEQDQPEEKLINCKYCRKVHMPRRCPAYRKRCSQCDKARYFEKVCRSQSRLTPRDDNRQGNVHEVDQDNQETEVATQEFDVVRSNVFNFHSVK